MQGEVFNLGVKGFFKIKPFSVILKMPVYILTSRRTYSAAEDSYTGTYQGGLVFYVNQSGMYCKNAEVGNRVFKFTFISGNRFILDENVQVEFVKDNQGNFSGIIMWWRDGRMSNKSKVE